MASTRRGNGRGSLFKRAGNDHWTASWFDPDGKRKERSTRTSSKSDAERIMTKWVEREELVRAGLEKPEGGTALDRHAAASLKSHINAFETAKRASGVSDRHLSETIRIIREVGESCDWKTLGQVEAEGLERYVSRKRAPTQDSDGKVPRAWTPRTAHKCITAVRTFTRWCVEDGRLAADPLARVKKPAPTRQRTRRMLQVEEWSWVRAVTEHGPERMGMSGHARRLLYEVAIQTGLRSGELSSLRRTSLRLGIERPYVLLEAGKTKNRKAARQFIKPELAADLEEFVRHLMPGAPVFETPRREHVATMLRADLAAARAAWLNQAGDDAQERIQREGSDFLLATDHDGRVIDFHALRHTCGAWAAISGASPKAIQSLMRHAKITMTLDTYGHLLPDEAAETVSRMPNIEPVRLSLTGTDDTPQRPAAEPAVAVRTGAQHDDPMRHPKTRKAPGEAPRAVFKRGGRDSNPQPPDRQSGTLTN